MAPPALDEAQWEELKEAVQQPPATSGVELANWYWKVVRQFVLERCGIELSRSSIRVGCQANHRGVTVQTG